MKINLIIGSGQLGSRHLQGLAALDISQKIYVIDASESSLTTAKDRANEISYQCEIYYTTDWADLPNYFDLVIVSTNADVREGIIIRLLEGFDVKYLVLEKVLFQTFKAYNTIFDLIANKKVQTWVNHPRRLYNNYKVIKESISGETIKLNVIGGNWGLACNGLHFIDLCSFLTGSKLQNISNDWLDDSFFNSKRRGYIEFTGTLRGSMENSSIFSITSLSDNFSPIAITVSTGTKAWVILEGFYMLFQDMSNGDAVKTILTTNYQSNLTTIFANNLFISGNCELPTYDDVYISHQIFIQTILNKYNSLNKSNSLICPIT